MLGAPLGAIEGLADIVMVAVGVKDADGLADTEGEEGMDGAAEIENEAPSSPSLSRAAAFWTLLKQQGNSSFMRSKISSMARTTGAYSTCVTSKNRPFPVSFPSPNNGSVSRHSLHRTVAANSVDRMGVPNISKNVL